MKTETEELSRVVAALDALRREVERLAGRVQALEAAAGHAPAAAVQAAHASTLAPPKAPEAQPSPQPAAGGEVDEHLAMVLAAAIAAYMGKKAHIRQIRLLGSAAWAQQGRVTVQASHAIPVQHG